MLDADGKTLEKSFQLKFENMDYINDKIKEIDERLNLIDANLMKTYQKVGIVKYDAFPDVGGRLSFALAMLDESDSGFVLNAIHGRDGCYTYIKEIVKGESYVALGQEEKEALRQAVNYFNDMPS